MRRIKEIWSVVKEWVVDGCERNGERVEVRAEVGSEVYLACFISTYHRVGLGSGLTVCKGQPKIRDL